MRCVTHAYSRRFGGAFVAFECVEAAGAATASDCPDNCCPRRVVVVVVVGVGMTSKRWLKIADSTLYCGGVLSGGIPLAQVAFEAARVGQLILSALRKFSREFQFDAGGRQMIVTEDEQSQCLLISDRQLPKSDRLKNNPGFVTSTPADFSFT